MLNKVYLIGNLGRDPEWRLTDSGKAVTRLSLATNRGWKNAEGSRQEKTEWHQVVCFGRQAEIAGEYLRRGRQVFVEGHLQTSSWRDGEGGSVRYRTEVVCDNLQMLGPSSGSSTAAAASGERDGGGG